MGESKPRMGESWAGHGQRMPRTCPNCCISITASGDTILLSRPSRSQKNVAAAVAVAPTLPNAQPLRQLSPCWSTYLWKKRKKRKETEETEETETEEKEVGAKLEIGLDARQERWRVRSPVGRAWMSHVGGADRTALAISSGKSARCS